MSERASVSMLRRMPLASRVGWMVAAVLCTLIECMDVVGMLVKPDDLAMLEGLRSWPEARVRVASLVAQTDQSYWLMRGNTILLALVAGLVAGRFAMGMSRSLRELRTAAQRVADGDLETQVQVAGAYEVGRLSRAIDRMRLSLREGLRLAHENAALREDLALSRAAGSLLTPKTPHSDAENEQLLGFHALGGGKVGFWWHAPAGRTGRVVVLGYVEGTGPAAVISLAALAGAVRDELLHVKDVDLSSLVKRAHTLCSGLTPHPMGLSALSLDAGSGSGHWVSAGAHAPSFLFHAAQESQVIDGQLHAGSVRFEDRLAVLLGPRKTEHAEPLAQVLTKLTVSSAAPVDLNAMLESERMPATVVMFQRTRGVGSQAA